MKTITTKMGKTNTPIKSTRTACFEKLMKLKKSELAEMASYIINLLNHFQEPDGSSYNAGWNDSRRAIIEIENLQKYLSHE